MPENMIIMNDIVKHTMQCFKEYAICHEQEVTERKRIVAQMKVINNMIEAKKEIYLKYLQMRFEERKELYKSVQVVIESATEKEDMEMLKIALDFQRDIYQKMPTIEELNIGSIGQTQSL